MCNSSSNLTYTCVSKRADGRGQSYFSAWKAFRPWLFPLLLHVPCIPSPPSVCSVVLKSALCRYTLQISSPRWHEKVPLRTETKLNQFWPSKWPGVYSYVPQKNQVWKRYLKYWLSEREQGTRGNGVISSSMSEISLHHSTVLKEKTIHLSGTSHQFFIPSE